MKVGIFVTARLGSSRLKRKHLLPVCGKPIIQYLLDRIAFEFAAELQKQEVIIVIVSSDEPENRNFECFTSSTVKVFFGATHNIPLRHQQAAESLGLDAVLTVDGDDILCSTEGMRELYQLLCSGEEYVRSIGLPFGMNSMGYAADFLKASVSTHISEVLETGWGRIFDEQSVREISLGNELADQRLRFTLDYQEDYEFFAAVIEALGERVQGAGLDTIVTLVRQRELFRINETIANEYWDNFYRCLQQEERA